MNFDTGMAVVVIAVLVFYLRLIVLQRERARREKIKLASPPARPAGKKKKKGKTEEIKTTGNYSILSQRRTDLVIAGIGVLAILLGVVLNTGWLYLPSAQPYWWVPTSAGIVAFSWAFRL